MRLIIKLITPLLFFLFFFNQEITKFCLKLINFASLKLILQVVWKSTTRVGAALAKVVDGGYTKTYVVARYLPQGNMKGRFAENVLPLAS